MAFTKQAAFTKKVTDLPDTPSPSYTATDIKNHIHTPSSELMTTVNKLVDDLNSSVAGSSGAKNTGASSITGLTGNDIQSLLESLKTKVDEKTDNAGDHLGTWQGYTPTQVDQTLTGRVNDLDAQLADIAINVKLFGAKGDGVTDDTEAIQNATNEALRQSKKLYFPRGVYYITSAIRVSNEFVNSWKIFEAVGELSGSAISAMEGYGTKGAVVLTNGCSAFELEFYDYFNESVKFRSISFRNKGVRGSTVAIHYKFNQTSYARKQLVEDCNFLNFSNSICYEGLNATFNNNYFGTSLVNFCHSYEVDHHIHFKNVFANLFNVSNNLIHGAVGGGVYFSNNAGGYITLSNTHFEGCEPAGIYINSSTHVKLVLDTVSSENTGDVSGNGLIGGIDPSNLELFVNNQVYEFALMPKEYRLPRGTVVSSNCPVYVSGEGIIIRTPDTIIPTVSNNVGYNQTDAYSLLLTPYQFLGNQYAGEKVFSNLAGAYQSGVGGISPNSSLLPNQLKKDYIGAARIINNVDESFTAPSDGYLYLTWLGKKSTVNSGFSTANILIDGAAVAITTGYRLKTHEGFYTLIIPIKTGQVLSTTQLTMYSMDYQSPALVTFSSSLKTANICCNGFPRVLKKQLTINANSSFSLIDICEYNKGFAVKVTLLFNGGVDGTHQFISRGAGTNATRVYKELITDLSANVTVTTAGSPLNTQMFNEVLQNLSVSTMTVDVEIEYLS